MSNKNWINIGGPENDINYRYKMPPLQTKVEGRGNGIKTVLLNVTKIAKHLRTEPSYITKFLGIEFAAQSKFNNTRDVGIVNGKHQKKDLQLILKKYIQQFILCKKCKLPELNTRISQNKQIISQKCSSCGWKGINSSNHNIKKYIITHPPKATKITKTTRKSKDIKEQKQNYDNDTSGWDVEEVWSVDAGLTHIAQQKHEEMKRLAAKNNINIDIDDEEKKDSKSPAQILRDYVNCGERSYLEILNEIKCISMARKYDQKRKLQITIEALCKLDTLNVFIESFIKYKDIFISFTSNTNDSNIFFGVLEEFICRRNPDEFLEKVYKILESLYDSEIVTEEDILNWYNLSIDKTIIIDKYEAEDIRNKAVPFIKWLMEDEDDNDNENEEES